jgi:hypothetical protein
MVDVTTKIEPKEDPKTALDPALASLRAPLANVKAAGPAEGANAELANFWSQLEGADSSKLDGVHYDATLFKGKLTSETLETNQAFLDATRIYARHHYKDLYKTVDAYQQKAILENWEKTGTIPRMVSASQAASVIEQKYGVEAGLKALFNNDPKKIVEYANDLGSGTNHAPFAMGQIEYLMLMNDDDVSPSVKIARKYLNDIHNHRETTKADIGKASVLQATGAFSGGFLFKGAASLASKFGLMKGAQVAAQEIVEKIVGNGIAGTATRASVASAVGTSPFNAAGAINTEYGKIREFTIEGKTFKEQNQFSAGRVAGDFALRTTIAGAFGGTIGAAPGITSKASQFVSDSWGSLKTQVGHGVESMGRGWARVSAHFNKPLEGTGLGQQFAMGSQRGSIRIPGGDNKAAPGAEPPHLRAEDGAVPPPRHTGPLTSSTRLR